MKSVTLVAFIFLRTSLQSSTELREYCYNEEFRAGCAEDDQVLVVRSALYGRMRRGRCLKGDYEGAFGCRENVLRQVDRLCSGRKNCSLRVNEDTFNVDPCERDPRLFLEIIYECLKVMTVASSDCTRMKYVGIKNVQRGYLSSFITQRFQYGTSSCPWRIELSRWQRVNLTLIDFSTPLSNSTYQDKPQYGKNFCHKYAHVYERLVTQRTERICGRDRRERNIFVSRTPAVEIKLVSREDPDYKEFYFLIRFDAIGCPDPSPPKNGWFQRESDEVTMYCNHSSVQWRLMCDDVTNRWIGHLENCTSVHQEGAIMVWGKVSIPQTVSIVLTATLCFIGVIIVVLISLLCLEWFKGNKQKQLRGSMQLAQDHQHEQEHTQQQHDVNENSAKTGSQHPVQASVSVIATQRTPSNREEPRPHPPGILRNAQSYQQRHCNYPASDTLLFSNMPEKAEEEKYKISRSSNSIVSNDYVREMWPMVPPPKLSGVEECVRPDSRADAARSSLFQYGDSVTLMSSCQGSSGIHLCRTLQPRGTPLVDLDDDTHIYETPKYLRREKAATMRLQSKPGVAKGLYCPVSSSGQQSTVAEHVHRSVRTLPRNVMTASPATGP